MRTWTSTIAIGLLALGLLGANKCSGGSGAPSVSLTLHAVEDDLKSLLIVPRSGLTIMNATVTPGAAPVDPAAFAAVVTRWGGTTLDVTTYFFPTATGALGVLPPYVLSDGTWSLTVAVSDVDGRPATATFPFAVRSYTGPPPIGLGQKIWYDFTADRDGVPGPDFPVDLQTLGLGSPADPALSAVVEDRVIEAVLDRVSEVYHGIDPNGLGFDPVAVDFHADDPGSGDVTRICVGGPDPSGQNVIGSIQIDPNNGNRSSVECGTIPPTGIFPRAMLVYQYQNAFRAIFDPLRASAGGTPVGEHPLDAIVLAPGFDPASGTPAEQARHAEIMAAVQGFGDALGSIVAHETGHALGMVAPGAPGAGLHGGQIGADFAHDVQSDGVTVPSANLLMKRGGSFSFAKLAGLQGEPLPVLRALDFAYLRDRVMVRPEVTALLFPPSLSGVTPSLISSSLKVTVTGDRFVATPKLRLVGPSYSYELAGEALLSATQMTGWVISAQVPDGTYDLVVENPDGQTAQLPAAVTIAK